VHLSKSAGVGWTDWLNAM